MDASGLILNLVQKATIKTETNEKCPINNELVTNDEEVPSTDQRTPIARPYPRNLLEKSCDDCQPDGSESTIFKVSLRKADEDPEAEKENSSRKRIRTEPISSDREKCGEQEKIFVLRQLGRSQIRSDGFPAFLCIDGRIADGNDAKRKIPRPANAFMLFANEWRKKLAAENPRESNKDISVRLGILWKNMTKDVKEKYFALAREVDAEHKRKYPVTSLDTNHQKLSSGTVVLRPYHL
ncbi:PREDICTED: transcription factor Sox-10-like [Dufourea novaeangliae]|uniref:transcription factor Sox-10-like n=1 Tax=Dufourea novaeangliae TaxID=178035 RepID=UPI000766F056|nr:PREDICTED: transcription factor Sox-10-like [Dufourea novaeangliae]